MGRFLLQMRISYLGELIKLFGSDYLACEDRGRVVERINLLIGLIERDLGLIESEEEGDDDE